MGCKDMGSRKSEYVAKAQFFCHLALLKNTV